jgi:EAL domain-containing protein (putative c-di-GMP-specific phosphodiesterase class I)
VRDIATDQRDRIFVQVIHQVGHSLGLKTIAEFVESERIHELLRDIGVDYVQGYAIGRPRPLIDWINRR